MSARTEWSSVFGPGVIFLETCMCSCTLCGIWLLIKRGVHRVIVHEPCLVLPYPVQVIHLHTEQRWIE